MAEQAEQKEFFKVEPLNVDNFIKVNNLSKITNPIFFGKNNVPTDDGLLSNAIFGITKDERSNTFAYISFGEEYFINPIMYEIWTKIDTKIVSCVYGNGTYSVGPEGKLINDPEGGTGIKFLKDNIDKIVFTKNKSEVRSANIDFMNKYRDLIFIHNALVIPAYYRDINTTDRYVGVGDINKLYSSLIISANSLEDYNKYGITIYDSVKGRIQGILVQLYNYFTKDTVAGKLGLLRRAASSKTADYSSRLVISAPNLKVENISDMLVDVDHAAVPLASICANFFPYMVVFIRNFFMNEYQNNPVVPIMIKGKKELTYLKIKDYRISFSDEVIQKELSRFIHGFSDRFRPIEVPLESNRFNKDFYSMVFKGYTVSKEKLVKEKDLPVNDLMPISERYMTWCDLFYMGAVEVTKDKTILVTRYPIDSCYNQFPLLINISSTIKTEPMVINGTLYKNYPYIRQEDINTNTSNKFIDTLSISNVYLGSIGGDYDGDQVTVKSVYSVEANEELRQQINSKRHYISLSGKNIMETTNEGAMALYSLTMNVDNSVEYTNPKF